MALVFSMGQIVPSTVAELTEELTGSYINEVEAPAEGPAITCGPVDRAQQLRDEIGHRGLAIRTGDANAAKLHARIPGEPSGNPTCPSTRVSCHDDRHAAGANRALRENRNRTLGDGRVHKIVAVYHRAG